jgi:hypothetical protein
LLRGGGDVGGVRVRHGLNGDWSAAAYDYLADFYCVGFVAFHFAAPGYSIGKVNYSLIWGLASLGWIGLNIALVRRRKDLPQGLKPFVFLSFNVGAKAPTPQKSMPMPKWLA